MANKEDIVWLDGYLKGITALKKGADGFTFNALLIKLMGADIVQSYLNFINKNDEAESLGIEFAPLKLKKCDPVDSWPEVVANNIGIAFSGMEAGSYQGVISQALDILDIVVPGPGEKKKFLCSAEIGKATGEYLFLQLTGNEYLVLSFLRHRLHAASGAPDRGARHW